MTTMRESLAAKMTAGAIAVVMTLSAFSTFAQTAHAATDIEELCALAASLGISTPEFDALCAGDSDDDSAGAGEYIHHPSIDFEFTRNLYIGSRGNDVLMLQKVLNLDSDTQVAASGVGSAGMETEYFGELTRQAVAKFQAKHDISPAAGYFYPLTRAEMNRMGSGSSDDSSDEDEDDNDVTGDTLEVEAGDQPDNMRVGDGQIHIPTTVIELTAGDEDVDVSEIVAEITGLARKDVDSVSVWHDGVILDTDSVNSDDEAELDLDLEINDGDTEELTFSVTMEDTVTKGGLDFQVEIVEIEAGSADVDGLPVDGTEHEVNESVELNTYQIDIDTETSDLKVGDEDEMIANVEFSNDNADDEDDSMYVQQFAMEQVGSADLDDLDNIYVEVDGDEYDGEVMGDYVIFDFGSGVEIEEDEDMDFEVYADIVNGAGDEIVFALDADDIVDWVFVVDEDDRLLAASATETDDADTEGFDIQTGDGTSDSSDEVRDGNVSPGEDDAEMAAFDLDIDGENVVDGEVVLTIDVSTSSTNLSDHELDNVKIVDEDGNVIASEDENDIVAGGGTEEAVITVTFEDVMFPEGDEVYYITADIDDSAPNNAYYVMQELTFDEFEGEDSEEDISIGDVDLDDVTQTVQGPAIEFGVDATLDKDTARSDQDDVELAVVIMDATESGEDVEVETLSLYFDIGQNAGTPNASDITNCVLVHDGDEVSDDEDLSGTGTTITQEFEMDSGFVVSEDTVMTVSLMCDLSNDFADTDTVTVEVDEDETEHDVESTESSEDVDITVDDQGTNDNTGEEITISDGAVTAQNGESATYASVRTGASMVNLGSVELDSDEVEGDLDEITFDISGADKIKSGTQIKVTTDDDGNDVVATFYKTSDGNYTIEEGDWDEVVTITDGINELFLWADTDSSVGTDGESLSINVASSTIYVDNDSFANSATTTLSGVKVYSGLPSFTSEAVDSNDVNSDDVLMKFAITAEGEDIVLASTTATSVAVTGSATTGTVEILFDKSGYNDAADGDKLVDETGDLTIRDGETYYFVVKSDSPVSEGDNNDKIRTTVDFTGAFTVNTVTIDKVESDLDDWSDNAESLVHTYIN